MASVYVSGGTLNKVNAVGTMDKLKTIETVDKIVSVGSKEGLAGIHIAALPCPSVTGEGMTRGWQILDIIGKATAVLASHRALKAAQMQNKIAREYYNLAKDEWDYFYNTFRPLEQAELAEIHATDPYKADYTTALEGHDCSDSVFENMTTHRERLMGMFCVCTNLDSSINYDLALSTIRGDSKNFARRYAEKQAQKLDDLRWNRKIAAAGRGRGLLSQSADLARISADKFGNYSNAMTKFAGQSAEFSEYIRNRMETVYNGEHTNRINTRDGYWVDKFIHGKDIDPEGYDFGIARSNYGTQYGQGGLSYEYGLASIRQHQADVAELAASDYSFYSTHGLSYGNEFSQAY